MKTTILQSLAVLAVVVSLSNCTAIVDPTPTTSTTTTSATSTDTMYTPAGSVTTRKTTTTY